MENRKRKKYPVIYCPPKLRNEIETIGKAQGITGITPTLNHIVTRYKQQGNAKKKGYKYQWF